MMSPVVLVPLRPPTPVKLSQPSQAARSPPNAKPAKEREPLRPKNSLSHTDEAAKELERKFGGIFRTVTLAESAPLSPQSTPSTPAMRPPHVLVRPLQRVHAPHTIPVQEKPSHPVKHVKLPQMLKGDFVDIPVDMAWHFTLPYLNQTANGSVNDAAADSGSVVHHSDTEEDATSTVGSTVSDAAQDDGNKLPTPPLVTVKSQFDIDVTTTRSNVSAADAQVVSVRHTKEIEADDAKEEAETAAQLRASMLVEQSEHTFWRENFETRSAKPLRDAEETLRELTAATEAIYADTLYTFSRLAAQYEGRPVELRVALAAATLAHKSQLEPVVQRMSELRNVLTNMPIV